MKIKSVAIWFVGAALSVSLMQASDAEKPEKGIAGLYSGKASEASQPALLAQGLGGILLGDDRFQQVKIEGTVDKINITERDGLLHVTAFDSAGRVVAEGDANAKQAPSGSGKYSTESSWAHFHEGRKSYGTTLTEIIKGADGSLVVKFATHAKDAKNEITSWLKFPAIDQVDHTGR